MSTYLVDKYYGEDYGLEEEEEEGAAEGDDDDAVLPPWRIPPVS